jgi:hypothetical protein
MHLIYVESEIGPVMHAHDFITYELEFHLDIAYIPIDEEVIGMLNEGDVVANNEPIEETSNVQIVDVVVNRVGFKDVECSLVTLEKFMQQIPNDVTPLN